MSQVSGPISINNGAASPVAKSFAPQQVAPGSSIFTERTATQSNGFLRLIANYSAASSKRPTHRVEVNIDLPVVESANGVNTVTKKGLFRSYFVIPDTFTAAERADLAAFAANALDVAIIRAIVKDLDPLY